MLITQAGGGGGGGGFGSSSTNRGSITVRLMPKDERTRASDQIAMDLRRRLVGPARASSCAPAPPAASRCTMHGGGNNDGSRLSVEIRGHELDERHGWRSDLKAMLDTTPGIADSRLAATKAGPSWPCASTATRRQCSA